MIEGLAQGSISAPVLFFGAASVLAIVLVALFVRQQGRKRKCADPLSGLFEDDVLELTIEAAERRVTPIKPRSAVLRAQIDHLNTVRTLWGEETRAEAIAQVQQVLRAGVRKSDLVMETEGPQGGGAFVILAHGANEEDANGIARRLLETLSHTPIGSMDAAMRMTASFGVAERRPGESEEEWCARADAALGAAQSSDDEQVINASEWEEVLYLPAPTSRGEDGAAAA